MSENLSYSEKGGIRIGETFWRSANYTYPFAVLNIDKDRIKIEYFFNEIIIPRSYVSLIKKKRGIFCNGAEITHSVADIRPFVLFWSFHFELLMENFERLGYPLVAGPG